MTLLATGMGRASILLLLGAVGCTSIVRSDRTFAAEDGKPKSDAGLLANDYEQLAYVKGEAPTTPDVFGYAVAMDADRLAVASAESVTEGATTFTNAGAVYVFDHISSDPIRMDQRLVSPVPQNKGAVADVPWELSKQSPTAVGVALSGDTLVMGMGGEDQLPLGGLVDTGAAYVFQRTDTEWTSTTPPLTGSHAREKDAFGFRVAISGDTIAVAAPWDDSSTYDPDTDVVSYDSKIEDSGAVYMFERDVATNTWNQVAYLKADIPAKGDEFGESIALQGDLLVVGAPGTSSDGDGIGTKPAGPNPAFLHAGAVYTFVRGGHAWVRDTYFKSSPALPDTWFGAGVALDGSTLVVGAPTEGPASHVYVYERSGGVWRSPTVLSSDDPKSTSGFGEAVAISGDTIAIGAFFDNSPGRGGDPLKDPPVPASGAVYAFERGSGKWPRRAYLKASNAQSGDDLGWSVAVSGAVIAAGAPFEASRAPFSNPNQNDNSAPYAGAVYTFAPVAP